MKRRSAILVASLVIETRSQHRYFIPTWWMTLLIEGDRVGLLKSTIISIQKTL